MRTVLVRETEQAVKHAALEARGRGGGGRRRGREVAGAAAGAAAAAAAAGDVADAPGGWLGCICSISMEERC